MSNRSALGQLLTCLRGELPIAPDWGAILLLSNRALVTGELYSAMARTGTVNRVPENTRRFLHEVFVRNRERNTRLSKQLGEVLQALSGAGMEPILLKGAAIWASSGRGVEFDRILADIDLMVRPSEADNAIDILERKGFRCASRYTAKEMHVIAEIARPTDVGFIDLHQRPPGPLLISDTHWLESHCKRICWAGSWARVPAPALQIVMLVLHDQFHDGDYWRGGFDLRHLMDISQLTRGNEPVDWRLLDEVSRPRLIRNALESQLIAAARFVDAAVPLHLTGRRWTRVQHQRHMWQFAHPWLSLPLAAIASIAESSNMLAYAGSIRPSHQATRVGDPVRKPLTSRMIRRAKRLKQILWTRPGKL